MPKKVASSTSPKVEKVVAKKVVVKKTVDKKTASKSTDLQIEPKKTKKAVKEPVKKAQTAKEGKT